MKFIKKEEVEGSTVITVKMVVDIKKMETGEARFIKRDDIWYAFPEYELVEGTAVVQLNAWDKYR